MTAPHDSPTRAIVAWTFLAAVLAWPQPAEANARLCRQLEADLAVSSGSGGTSAQARKYDQAIAAQENQIGRARSQARAEGCGFMVFGNRARAQCASLNATIAKMERNLMSLQGKRSRMGGGEGSRRKRARILAALDMNGCRERGEEADRSLPRAVDGRDGRSLPGGLSDRGRRERRPIEDYEDDGVRAIINDGHLPRARTGQTFRTMCVRICDGYYFPIANNSTTREFERDQKICNARCPGAEVDLHYHRFPRDDSEDMVSASTGRPYREMDNAFLYRETDFERPAGCGCDAKKNFSIIAGELPEADPVDQSVVETVVPRPWLRPDPAADPETLANEAGGLDLATLKRLVPRPVAAQSPTDEDGEKRVRVVGPGFLPDPEEAIDLRVQDRKTVR